MLMAYRSEHICARLLRTSKSVTQAVAATLRLFDWERKNMERFTSLLLVAVLLMMAANVLLLALFVAQGGAL